MNAFCFVSRRHALAALAFGLAALADAPAIAEGDIYVHAGANFKPVTIAVTPFAGEEGGDKISGVVASDFARSIFLLPLNPANFPEKIANPDAPPPKLVMNRPYLIGTGYYIIEGTTDPGSTVLINNEEVDVESTGHFKKLISLSKIGRNEIVIKAINAAGKQTVQSQTVLVEE